MGGGAQGWVRFVRRLLTTVNPTLLKRFALVGLLSSSQQRFTFSLCSGVSIGAEKDLGRLATCFSQLGGAAGGFGSSEPKAGSHHHHHHHQQKDRTNENEEREKER